MADGHLETRADEGVDGNPDEQLCERLTLRYMRHYSTATDFTILMRNIRNL